MYEWMSDCGHTPHILVDADIPGVQVPMQFAQDGKIVLNISAGATQGLLLGNYQIEFNARFGGEPMHVAVPMPAVMAIYARETTEGMMFSQDDDAVPGESAPRAETDSRQGEGKPRGKPDLKIIK
jgi:stringent starvation protein B